MVCTLLFSPAAMSDQRPVHELMQLTDLEAMHSITVDQTLQQVDAMLDQLMAKFDDEDERVQAATTRYTEGLRELIATTMSWETVGPDSAQVIESIYTDSEIRDLIAFYKSDLGQVLRAKGPLVTQELMVKQGAAMQRMTTGIQRLMQQLNADLRAIKAP